MPAVASFVHAAVDQVPWSVVNCPGAKVKNFTSSTNPLRISKFKDGGDTAMPKLPFGTFGVAAVVPEATPFT